MTATARCSRRACSAVAAPGDGDGTNTLRVGVDTLGLVDQDDVLPDTASMHVRIRGEVVSVVEE